MPQGDGRHRRCPAGGERSAEDARGRPGRALPGAAVRAELQGSRLLFGFGGAKEKDGEFLDEYSAIVEDGGLGKTAAMVLVAREKDSGLVVGYCQVDHSDEELRIAQLKVRSLRGGFVSSSGCVG